MKTHLSRFVIALTLLIGSIAPATHAAAAAPICYGSTINSVDIVTINPQAHPLQWREGLRSPDLLTAIVGLSGRQTWVGYDHGGFDPITDVYEMRITVYWTDQAGDHSNVLWIGSAAGRPDYRQIYWFPNMNEYTGADGKHMGPHPICGWNAIEVPVSVVDNLRALAGLR